MKTITHNSSAENWLLLNLLRPYLRNQFVDRGKWFLMERLNPKPGDDLGWGKIGILASKVYDGTFIRCDMQHAADRFMYFTGEYEIGTTRFLSRVAGKNWRMVDVGANVGKYMVLAAPLVKEVHCFEPNPISRDLLEANVKLNEFDNVRVHSLALSDQDGRTVLFQSGENIGGHLYWKIRKAPNSIISAWLRETP